MRPTRGMTLIEILIAIAIMGLMMMLAWSTIKGASDARVSFEAMEDRNHEVRLAMARLVADLESAYLSKNEDLNLDNKRTQFVGKEEEVRFSSLGHVTLWADSNESDQTLIAYYLDDTPRGPDGKAPSSSTDSLFRRELRRPTNEPWDRQPGDLDVLIRDVEKLEFEYWNWQDKKWQSEWDSTKADGVNGRLPTRVRIKLTYKNPRGEEVTVTTQARLLLEERLQF
ncbi:MAG: prepilin-type N-terminal cleavage/methylation domain-containing protein [Kofleriaceae bacterium]|jgi:prepilin-type N-terminal cleavage/methylation domain-containing protein|nr:prepilin-type N-terminal cleavage/methylation domain-containing protein [Kofleriaceae bacterium]